MKRILFRILILFLCPGSASAAELVWEVEHPFRFLRFASDHRVHELSFEHARRVPDFRQYPVSTMEALLNDPDWWQTKSSIASADGNKRAPFEEVAALRERLEGPETVVDRSVLSSVSGKDVRFGWAAMLRTRAGGQPADGTCWNHTAQRYQFCESAASGTRGGIALGM